MFGYNFVTAIIQVCCHKNYKKKKLLFIWCPVRTIHEICDRNNNKIHNNITIRKQTTSVHTFLSQNKSKKKMKQMKKNPLKQIKQIVSINQNHQIFFYRSIVIQ